MKTQKFYKSGKLYGAIFGLCFIIAALCICCIQALPIEKETSTTDVQVVKVIPDIAFEELNNTESSALIRPEAIPLNPEESLKKISKEYGKFPEEDIKFQEFPSELSGEKSNSNDEVDKDKEDKCCGDAYLSRHPDFCQDIDEEIPEYHRSVVPECPKFNHREVDTSKAWQCFPHPALRFVPNYQPNNSCSARTVPKFDGSFFNPVNPFLGGYGFGPQYPRCRPRDIDRYFLERSLRNHKAFGSLKNCSYV